MSQNFIKDWLSAELQKSHSVVVYINPLVPGVQAPADLCAKPSFTLQLSKHFDRPLILGASDFKSDFLFENGFQSCVIPWSAIWAAHPENQSDQIVFWNQNSPGEGWDKALVEYLGSEVRQIGEASETKEGSEVKQSSQSEKSRARMPNLGPKARLSAVAPSASVDVNSVSESSELKNEKEIVAMVEGAKANSSNEKSAKLSRSHLKLIK